MRRIVGAAVSAALLFHIGHHRRPRGRGRNPSEHPDLWHTSGRAGFGIVPTIPTRLRFSFRTMSNRATPAVHRPGAPLHATMQAAGAPSAGSQSFNILSRDRADGATLRSHR